MVIDHGYGVVTRFAHLSVFLKDAGESVKRGEAVASSATRGAAPAPISTLKSTSTASPWIPRIIL